MLLFKKAHLEGVLSSFFFPNNLPKQVWYLSMPKLALQKILQVCFKPKVKDVSCCNM